MRAGCVTGASSRSITLFRYRFFLAYLDLGGAAWRPRPLSALLGAPSRPVRFRRADYLGDPARPLDECVRDVVEAPAPRPAGPVRLLTGLRYLGHTFNLRLRFYYCFDPTGRRVEDVVAEVENIPWGERHAYVLERRRRGNSVGRRAGEETPRLAPDGDGPDVLFPRPGTPGEWAPGAHRVRGRAKRTAGPVSTRRPPGARGCTPKTSTRRSRQRRRELSRPLMLGLLARYPAMSLQVVAKIYAQAARPKLKELVAPPSPRPAVEEDFAVDGPRRGRRGAGQRRAAARSRSWRTARPALLGEPTDLRATVRINNPAAWRGAVERLIGLGESYVDVVIWETDDLVALIQIAARASRGSTAG